MKHAVPVFNFTVQNKTSDDSLDVYVDGAIVDSETEHILKDWFGDDTSLSYKTFRNNVEAANPKNLNIYINSPGGHAGDSLAMHDYIVDLQNNKRTNVKVYNRGMVGSAATYFQMAVPVENRYASNNSFQVIHNVQGGVIGSLREMQSYVNNAEKMNKSIVNLYANNTKLSWQKITDMMDAETLLTADEMLEHGFVGNITSAAPVKKTVDLSNLCFKNSAILNAYNSFTEKNTSIMDMQKVTDAITNGFNSVLEKLGITNKKDEQPVKDAFTEFSTSIVNALKEAQPSQESIQQLVNTAVTDATKNFITNESLAAAITNATKETVTKADLTKSLSDMKNELISGITDKIGNKSEEKTGDDKKKVIRKTNNRFAGTSYEN